MRHVSALGLVAVLAACVSAPDAPAAAGMSMSEYAKTCSSGEPNYGSVGATVYADCPSKPDEWIASDGSKVTAVYSTPEFIAHQQDLQCGADEACRGQVATAALQWVGEKRSIERSVKTENRDAWVQFLLGPTTPGGESAPLIAPRTDPAPAMMQTAPASGGPTRCRSYRSGNEVVTECS